MAHGRCAGRFRPDGGETMRTRNGFGITLLFFFALAFYRTPSLADTSVGGLISSDTTWTLAGSPYIITSNISVYGSGSPTLTIEPGVIVKFNDNTGLSVANGTSNPGALKAVGTASSPILFTSSNPSPAPGKWSGITFRSGTVAANSALDYVTVE